MRSQMVLLVCASLIAQDQLVVAQPFNPVREVSSWNTDRTVIDIQIVGSTSLLPDVHRLEPERVLRFRLERAYVWALLAKGEPGFELLGLGVDWGTGLPHSLVTAVSRRGRFHKDIAGVPRLSLEELSHRHLAISTRSDASAALLTALSVSLKKCQGADLGDGLYAYERERDEARCGPAYFSPDGVRRLAPHEGLLLRVDCARKPRRRDLGCKLELPFQGFRVDVGFHHDHVRKWREIVGFVTALLESKRYTQ